MKKLISLILAIVIAVSMTACGGESSPKIEPNSENTNISVEKGNDTHTEEKTIETPATNPADEPEGLTGIRPEFKKAMDDYEAFFDKYIDFINKYENASTTELMALMADYMQYMTDFAEAMDSMEEMESQDMSTEETLYYAQVTSRISAKLMAVS